nr:immunoglobulin light chain junction region [Macaca mulatta]MOW11057.1 immunoglobulin light chain junction region [Macaca mulatta]MOW11304.1 immunoglobulin light chain junction region [Macaca mulatta]MOW12637.1 immunoglobulin light chain junction region [Macaca mulatta]MOW13012.1 immunoglobulin light chain junction region [Macaca mulatta]
CMQTLQNPLTF